MRRSRLTRALGATGLVVLGLLCPDALAGLGPLTRAGKKVHLAKQSPLSAERDRIHYRILPDRVEAEQNLLVTNPGPRKTFLLGLPLPKGQWLGPQDVVVERLGPAGPRPLRTRRVPAFGWRPVEAWQVVELALARDERVELRIGWWQPHAVGELHGYPRLVLTDPVWSAGSFAGPVPELERLVKLEGGAQFSASQPEAEELSGGLGEQSWELRDRRWHRADQRPGDQEVLALFYKLTRGAHSRCADADPWQAVDGDPQTVWRPEVCPGSEVALELAAQCRGFGTGEPRCDSAPVLAFDLGLSVRTPDPKANHPVQLEGWWGPKRRWLVSGRQNRVIPIRRREPVTRYRVVFPKGLPETGAGEVNLFRLDPAATDPNVESVLQGNGWHKTTRRCRLRVGLVNPVALRHASLRLRPGTKMDAFLITADCADGRKRLTFHEPVPCNHSAKEIAEARRALGDPTLEPMHHAHYRRKHPLQIELKLDPTCVMTEFAIMAPPVCTDSWLPVVPRVTLDF